MKYSKHRVIDFGWIKVVALLSVNNVIYTSILMNIKCNLIRGIQQLFPIVNDN